MAIMNLPGLKKRPAAAQSERRARVSSVSGDLEGFDIRFNEKRDRTLLVVQLRDATVAREDGSAETRPTFEIPYTYSSRKRKEGNSWVPDLLNADETPAMPRHTTTDPYFLVGDPFYDVLVPEFKAAGIDLWDLESTPEGTRLDFERRTVARAWANDEGERGNELTQSRLLRSDNGFPERTDDDRVIYLTEDDEEIQWVKGDGGPGHFETMDGEATDAKPADEVVTFTDLLPTAINN